MKKLLFFTAFMFFKTSYIMDAQIKKDQTDGEINTEYRKTRDIMNSKGKFKSTFKIANPVRKPANANLKEGIAMREGKMVSVKDETVSPMNYNITLVNGTHVNNIGVCELKNGKKITLKEGDFMDYNGVYVPKKK